MSTPPEPSDESLRKLLREMEAGREKLAPSFQRVWHRARQATEQGRERRLPAWWPVWTAAGAAAVALGLAAVLPSGRTPALPQPDLAATMAAVEDAIARMPARPLASTPTLPAWASPTASLLEQPGFPP